MAPRHFRLGPAPLAPKPPEPSFAQQKPHRLAEALRLLAVAPPELSTAHMALRFPPVAQFLERWRSLLRRRSRLDFEEGIVGCSRIEIAVAFLALLELFRDGMVAFEQAAALGELQVRWTGPEAGEVEVDRQSEEHAERHEADAPELDLAAADHLGHLRLAAPLQG